MDKRTWCFVAGALLLSVALAAFVSPFASAAPDGLERAAGPAAGGEVWTHAPWADYKVLCVKNGAVSTGLSGAAGTLVVFACGWGLSKVLARRNRKRSTGPRAGVRGETRFPG